MSPSIPVTIIRHYKERKSKCSLQPLKGEPNIQFIDFKPGLEFNATNYIVLNLEGKPLSEEDAESPLLILDSTWRLLPQLERCLTGTPIYRTLPHHIETAYPRVSKNSEDPLRGLASVEALYVAKKILGDDNPSLLQHYHWRDPFLAKLNLSNPES